MSAERLRAAATLLRERAEAATPGPWHVCDRAYQYDEIDAAALVCGESHDPIAANSSDWYETDDDEPTPDTDAAYIATMSPPVALALADWLDSEAERVEEGATAFTFGGAPMFPPNPHALAVADAILGGVE